MKKIVYIFLAVISSVSFVGCSFLDERSQDEVKPSTVDDLVQLMLGEGYMLNDDFFNFADLLTDDVQQKFNDADDANNTKRNNYIAFYKWDPNMFEEAKTLMVQDYNDWKYFYSKIKGCNVILDYIDRVDGGHAARENLRGQALGMRAYYYFMLVNLYGAPYNSGDPSNLMGVPLILEPQVEDSYPKRASVKEVYEQIIKDLNTAYPLLDEYGKTNIVYRVGDKFVHMLLARVYLYIGDWEKVIEHSSHIIKVHPALAKLTNYAAEDFFGEILPDYNMNVYSYNSVEMIWAFGKSPSTIVFLSPAIGMPATFSVSDELSNLYRNDDSGIKDLRTEFFYVNYFTSKWYTKGLLYGDKGNRNSSADNGFRSAEAYLNRAEANIRLAIEGRGGDISQALSDLNALRESRFDTKNGLYTPITISDPEELLAFYKEERRRELSFEYHRWFDLRRYGMPEIKHKLELSKGIYTYVNLSENSKSYVLPIPLEVITRNPSIVQNPF